jgi:hypothetical protein
MHMMVYNLSIAGGMPVLCGYNVPPCIEHIQKLVLNPENCALITQFLELPYFGM